MAVQSADLVITGGRIWTQDPGRPGAEALAVRGGALVAVGTTSEVEPFIGPRTAVHDVDGAMVLPGLVDGHVHLNLGGSQAAFELPLLPADDRETVLGKVRERAGSLEPDAWVVGGIIGSGTMGGLADADALARLDEAGGGRPVLLRDDTMHSRWVSSRALELMGVDAGAPDPEGGRYARDHRGRLTGVLHEAAAGEAEAAFARSVPDPRARFVASARTAIGVLNRCGVTSAQEAATMLGPAEAYASLEASDELNARIVLSTPARPFLEEGVVGAELAERAGRLRADLVRPDFVKIVLDGVPTSRTSALLVPYACHHGGANGFRGEPYWSREDLVAELKRCDESGLGAKMHATGDASVRLALDAAEELRATGSQVPLQIAHTEFVDPEDVARFGELDVAADLSPHLWYPGIMRESIAEQVPDELVAGAWPTRDLLDGGALLAAGSDWPCAAPDPDPWAGMEALVTRRDPRGEAPGSVNSGQALTVQEAVAAFTVDAARAAGIDDVAGRLVPGRPADFAVLDRDLFDIAPEEIHRTTVTCTCFAGRVVHGGLSEPT